MSDRQTVRIAFDLDLATEDRLLQKLKRPLSRSDRWAATSFPHDRDVLVAGLYALERELIPPDAEPQAAETAAQEQADVPRETEVDEYALYAEAGVTAPILPLYDFPSLPDLFDRNQPTPDDLIQWYTNAIRILAQIDRTKAPWFADAVKDYDRLERKLRRALGDQLARRHLEAADQ